GAEMGFGKPHKEVSDRVGHRHDSGFTFLAAVPLLRACRALSLSGLEFRPFAQALIAKVHCLLPAGLLNAWEFAGMCHLAKADAAKPELAVHRVRTTAPVAARVTPHLELGLLVGLVDQSLLCHLLSSP